VVKRPRSQAAKYSPAGPKHVVLVGLSGSGKSTVGTALAALLEREFVDTDALIEQAAGKPITAVFATQGEDAFRVLEAAAVRQAVAGPPAVISTGGGAPMFPHNHAALWQSNFVVWLHADLDTLVARVGSAGSGRPLLAGDTRTRLAALGDQRNHVYAQAHARVDTDRQEPFEIATSIVTLLRRVEEEAT